MELLTIDSVEDAIAPLAYHLLKERQVCSLCSTGCAIQGLMRFISPVDIYPYPDMYMCYRFLHHARRFA